MPGPEINPSTPDNTDSQAPKENEKPDVKSQSEIHSTAPSANAGVSTTSNPIDNPQSLPSVIVDVQEKPDVKEPSLPIIGSNLSRFVLFIISGFILALIIFLFIKDFDASSSIKIPTTANISDSTYSKKIELVKLIQERKKELQRIYLANFSNGPTKFITACIDSDIGIHFCFKQE